ncbi:dTDP-4-dehydrorhamnose reductase [Aquimarina sp. MMG015]|uniref:dTDP-4-dehydrorhamnose reductase n=1 Tax=Aquimarina sp. MMG015 TaxID=2822689 RepID=UPI001B3A3EDF|nr:dTDP-4-dehydrorhamnose reductase [Aquimarina sp. MMG015]MBQ4801428.1 dTDP-4-dehydrorhamnose reductase [Aquimarina sp. MMG015]
MKKILVTGAKGQLARCIKKLQNEFEELTFVFGTREDVDITNKELLNSLFYKESFNYVINCAAYTNVEQAEKDSKQAYFVNAEGVKSLSEVCKEYNTILIHISTDYIFDGNQNIPYSEKDISNPINEYGKSKLQGEKYIQKLLNNFFIIRTSWLYSQYGKNFFNTIVSKSEKGEKLTIVNSEIGTPTNANDLAKFILHIIVTKSDKYGIYHFSNLGEGTWYDFAKEILINIGKIDTIQLKKTNYYPTFAKRPKFSVLSKNKSTKSFNFNILSWKKSLKELIVKLE